MPSLSLLSTAGFQRRLFLCYAIGTKANEETSSQAKRPNPKRAENWVEEEEGVDWRMVAPSSCG